MTTAAENAERMTEAKRANERWVVRRAEKNDDDGTGAVCVPEEKKPASTVASTVEYAPRSAFMTRAPARVSFGGHNKETETMNAERAEREKRARAFVAANAAKTADVSDLEMARASAFAKKQIESNGSGNRGGFKRPPPLTHPTTEGRAKHKKKKKKKKKEKNSFGQNG